MFLSLRCCGLWDKEGLGELRLEGTLLGKFSLPEVWSGVLSVGRVSQGHIDVFQRNSKIKTCDVGIKVLREIKNPLPRLFSTQRT